jgi:prolipoprotein diacylglyceryltransferase
VNRPDVLFFLSISVEPLPPLQRHHWVDRLDPWAIHFYGTFGIRCYGLAYLAGFLLGRWILLQWARKGKLSIPDEEVPHLCSTPYWA